MPAHEALKACALFKGFTDTGLQILGAIATERTFPRGSPLFVENMVGDALLIVGSGKVRLSAKKPTGEDMSLGELGPGDYLGELSLIHQSKRLCTAMALSEVTAFEIRQGDFQKLLGAKPQACVKLLMAIVAGFGQKVTENREAFRALLAKG